MLTNSKVSIYLAILYGAMVTTPRLIEKNDSNKSETHKNSNVLNHPI